jgi:hypothetical protein
MPGWILEQKLEQAMRTGDMLPAGHTVQKLSPNQQCRTFDFKPEHTKQPTIRPKKAQKIYIPNAKRMNFSSLANFHQTQLGYLSFSSPIILASAQ